MSFFISRASAAARSEGSQDRGDVFARGTTAVLVVADGAGGLGGGAGASDVLLERARDAVLDAGFDLLAPAAWVRLFREVDAALARGAAGETTAVVVVLAEGATLCVTAGDSEAWLVGAAVDRLTEGARTAESDRRVRLGSGRAEPVFTLRGELEGRLVVATDGLFRHVAPEHIAALVREERFGRVADALIEAARSPGGALADDVVVLVAERS
jgi:PPM family protein phosphatase